MAEQHFQLTVWGALTDARLDALVEAGCDDAKFSSTGELTFAEFDSGASTSLDAVLSAITAVESVGDLEVLAHGPRAEGGEASQHYGPLRPDTPDWPCT